MPTFTFDKSEIGSILASELLKDQCLSDALNNYISEVMMKDSAIIIEIIKSVIESSNKVDDVLTKIAKDGGIEDNEIKSHFMEEIKTRIDEQLANIIISDTVEDIVREKIGDIKDATDQIIEDKVDNEMATFDCSECAADNVRDFIRREANSFLSSSSVTDAIESAIADMELTPYVENEISKYLNSNMEEIVRQEVRKQLSDQNLDEIECKTPNCALLTFKDDMSDDSIKSTIKFLTTCVPGVNVVLNSGENNDRK